MSPDTIHNMLMETGRYHTDPKTRACYDRWLGWCDPWLYLRMWGVVIRHGVPATFGRFDRAGWRISAYQMLRLYEGCGARVSVTGIEKVRDLEGPAVYVANHMGTTETLLLPFFMMAFCRPSVIVKQSLLSYPLFGPILRKLDPIGVTRSQPREDLKIVMNEGKDRLQRGLSVLVFPQATRSREFDPTRFNSIGVKLARRAGVPVVPVALRTDFQGLGRVVKDLGPLHRSRPVVFSFGEPRDSSAPEKETQGGIVDYMKTTLTGMGIPIREAI